MNELKLLKGSPIQIREGLKVYPLILSDIADIGEETYNSFVRMFLLNKTILNSLDDTSQSELNEVYKYNDLEFVFYLCGKDGSMIYYLVESLKIFLRSNVEIKQDIGVVIENEEVSIVLDNDIFLEIKKIILKQNFIKDNENSSFKPANKKAKELMEKLKKAKEKIQKQNKEEGLSLKEIISIVATYSNDLNILSIWNLTVNQLYEAYLRLMLWDDYHNKFVLLPHTTDTQSLDLKHWAVDINKIK